jgi:hypothetical protein
MRVPFPPHPCQHLLLVVLLIAILARVRWNLNVVLIYISFMSMDGENCSCVFVHLGFSFEKVVFRSVVHFFIGSLIFEFSFLSSLYILVISTLSDVYLANIFYHSVGGLFNVDTISFVVQKLFNFM